MDDLQSRLAEELAPGSGEFDRRLGDDEAQRRLEEFRQALHEVVGEVEPAVVAAGA